MEIARVVSERSTCRRRRVGAVIVSFDNRILSTGYNGTPSKAPHCTDTPCPGIGFHSGEGLDNCQALHAEQNAIARLRDIDNAYMLVCTTSPCIMCTKLIAATPITVIVAGEPYSKSGEEFWTEVCKRKWKNLGF